MTTTTARAVLLGALMATVSAAPARGQPRLDPAAQAKAHYELGMRAYNRHDYDRAIASFQRAHQLDPRPNLLYNTAQSYWKKGDDAQALTFYRRYLDASPGASDRELVQARIRALSAGASDPPSATDAPDLPATPGPTAGPIPTAEPGTTAAPRPANGDAAAKGGLRYWEPGSPRAAPEVTGAPVFAAPPPSSPGELRAEREPPVYRQPLFWGTVAVAALTAVAAIVWLRPQDRWSCPAAECFMTRTVP